MKPIPAVPEGVSPARFFGYLAGPILLTASAGVQLILALMLLIDPPAPGADRLTAWGRMFFVPEREVDIYIAGVVATLGSCLLLAMIWGTLFGRSGRRPSRRLMVVGLAVRCAVAAGATMGFLGLWAGARTGIVAGNDAPVLAFVLIALVTLAAALPFELLLRGESEAAPVAVPGEPPARPALRFSVLDLLVPALVFMLVFVPAGRQLAGRSFLADAFFHWDYYTMGPALAFSHGGALGTDVYTMYGLGWPAVFGMLPEISYGRLIQLSTLYACLYFSGVYLLMRLLVRRPLIAAAATGLAMLQLFLGMSDAVVWVLPSLTVLRWAFDVWCFAALVRYRNTRRPVWAVLAGAAVGASLVFSTDTGLYLAAAVAFYGICAARAGKQEALRLRDAAGCAVSALVVLLAGLAVAARGGVFGGEFWSGWLEPLRDYRGGFAQVSFEAGPSGFTVACFALLAIFYLSVAGRSLAGVLYRRAGVADLFSGTFAVYGLMNLLHFVGRSVDGTLPRLILPLVFVLAALGGDAYSRRAGIVRSSVALALLAALLLGPSSLLLDPVRAYPSLAAQVLRGRAPDGLCLMERPKDVCGLPEEFAGTVERFQEVAGRLETLKQQDRSVAVLDESGAILYLASGQKPFGRYPRMFLNMYSRQNLDRVTADLAGEEPDYVLTRKPLEASDPDFDTLAYFGIGPREDTPYPDAWERLLAEVRRGYTLEEELVPFELWVRRPSPGP